MKRVLLLVAYDGTSYSGWQVQPNADTIEGQLNKHLSAFFEEEITVTGASRTDAGVHAKCNMAVFDTSARMPAEKISYALNQRLPEDIRIIKSLEVAGDFHPRKINTQKTYEYKIYNAEFPSPQYRRESYFTYVPLDVEKMRQAATYLIGEHDFFSLSTYKPEIESTIRTIYDLTIDVSYEDQPYAGAFFAAGQSDKEKQKNMQPKVITIRVSGNGFLYNMVRIIAGTLIEVGRGKLSPEKMTEILEKRDRQLAGPTAPANGLTLVKYEILESYT